MPRLIYDQTYYIILDCEECGLMGNGLGFQQAYFDEGGHLVDYPEIRTPGEARQAQRLHQKWHDATAGYPAGEA